VKDKKLRWALGYPQDNTILREDPAFNAYLTKLEQRLNKLENLVKAILSDHEVKAEWVFGRYELINSPTRIKEPTPGDYKPDRYHLIDSKTLKQYVFTPHHGVEKP